MKMATADNWAHKALILRASLRGKLCSQHQIVYLHQRSCYWCTHMRYGCLKSNDSLMLRLIYYNVLTQLTPSQCISSLFTQPKYPSSNQSFKSFHLFRGSNNTCCELVTRPTIFSLISLKPINRQSSMHPFRAKFLTGKTFGNKLQPNILNSESAPCEQEFRKMIFLLS